MDRAPPRRDDPPDVLYEKARRLHEEVEAKDAVIERVKRYVAPWMTDKRMKILGGMLLREIEAAEREESEKRRSDP